MDAAVVFLPGCGWGRYHKIPTSTDNSCRLLNTCRKFQLRSTVSDTEGSQAGLNVRACALTKLGRSVPEPRRLFSPLFLRTTAEEAQSHNAGSAQVQRHSRKNALLLKLSQVDPSKQETPRRGFLVLGWCIFGDLFRRNKVTSRGGASPRIMLGSGSDPGVILGPGSRVPAVFWLVVCDLFY